MSGVVLLKHARPPQGTGNEIGYGDVHRRRKNALRDKVSWEPCEPSKVTANKSLVYYWSVKCGLDLGIWRATCYMELSQPKNFRCLPPSCCRLGCWEPVTLAIFSCTCASMNLLHPSPSCIAVRWTKATTRTYLSIIKEIRILFSRF